MVAVAQGLVRPGPPWLNTCWLCVLRCVCFIRMQKPPRVSEYMLGSGFEFACVAWSKTASMVASFTRKNDKEDVWLCGATCVLCIWVAGVLHALCLA